MAEQVVIMVWCDLCLAAEEKREASPYIADGHRVDLCEIHAEPVIVALDLLTRYGRVEKPSTAPRGGNRAPMPCPECGEIYRGPQGLGGHRRRRHGIAGVNAKPVNGAKVGA
jgi:hypothetical protein